MNDPQEREQQRRREEEEDRESRLQPDGFDSFARFKCRYCQECTADYAREHDEFRRVAQLTGLSRSELSRIRKGERRRVLYSTADKILGICQDDRAAGRWGSAA